MLKEDLTFFPATKALLILGLAMTLNLHAHRNMASKYVKSHF